MNDSSHPVLPVSPNPHPRVTVTTTELPEGGEEAHLLMVEVTPPEAGPERVSIRRPLQLGLALDRSSSMAGATWSSAVAAARALIEALQPQDRLSLIAFDRDVRVLADGEPMTAPRKSLLLRELSQLHPGYGTRMDRALLETSESLAKVRVPAAEPRLLFITDGLPSYGMTDPEGLAQLAASLQKGGVGQSYVGIGARYDAVLLGALAARGGGAFYDVPDMEAFSPVLAREVEGLCSAVATGVAVEVELSPGQVGALRLLHDVPTQHRHGGLRVELGDLGQAPRRLLFRWDGRDPPAAQVRG